MSETEEQRMAREESHWSAGRMFVLGFGFLGLCLFVILAMPYFTSPAGYSLWPWR